VDDLVAFAARRVRATQGAAMQTVKIEWTRIQGIAERLPEAYLRALYATASIQLDIQAAPNELLVDPALDPGGYEATEQRLRPASHAFAPDFFILGRRPKSGDPTVLGETFGIRHGLGAVYLENLSSATGAIDPAQLLHTAAHEIGHLCNLPHGSASVSSFPSVMTPARFRTVAPWLPGERLDRKHSAGRIRLGSTLRPTSPHIRSISFVDSSSPFSRACCGNRGWEISQEVPKDRTQAMTVVLCYRLIRIEKCASSAMMSRSTWRSLASTTSQLPCHSIFIQISVH
jgi:hypothetical protein